MFACRWVRSCFLTIELETLAQLRCETSHSKIIRMSDVCFETNTGCKLTLKDVRYVPDLRLNLMSSFTLDKQGYENHFSKGKWKSTRGSMVVVKGETCCTLYKTQRKVCNDELCAIEGTSMELWHKRLRHMTEKGLQILVRNFLIPLAKNEYCLLVIIVWWKNNIEFPLVVDLRRS